MRGWVCGGCAKGSFWWEVRWNENRFRCHQGSCVVCDVLVSTVYRHRVLSDGGRTSVGVDAELMRS